jgi:hypothetical protein
MFGVLKSGIKLGIGCFVVIVLTVALVAGAIWYYWGKSKPSERPRNGRRSSTSSASPNSPPALIAIKANSSFNGKQDWIKL